MYDARMLDTSGLYVDLAQFAFSPAGQECVSTVIWHILYVPICSAPSDMGC